ncbi:asparagine synthase (glutamine-hydrolyzing) [Paenibacillus jamilae]|jgi:asparagine synthase (glutamine-hydrolysing)|uniref:asparagine synthase (glutamine-hydrolyzing) n=1 Tax=Paenibacillus TaxID=44249 RepID=UPI000D2FE08C|nr:MULTISPECIES: asparagine synthase (glutamine-hydrolyzing) [Paenibacillus]MDP9678212.1 asparagine synthase (glutamine-hydrolyzing) [Paenibacillus jamilae]KAF6614397.1 asparagine synthase (glutamine-hydrolyzing) [Paenibacillus sp. EKM101P]KAF6616638.1 asparagine synthase (glutamine-hydrolyzing) [Paenibacillus sp. EKM102P]KAF6625503.1 asparagine synthase (glutamine-hydrolyzing) [Paenibacillus sp. EKM10P]KAF6641741.1 asparagine synthase (glutamine-hydrolyzing) [Paenibacillus sp. EKM11P]
MCGIAGIYDIRNENRIEKHIILNMIEKLSHRGPDGIDFYQNEQVSLGFARLSIIDLTTGMQPIANEDNTKVLICNGEIFNYLELREQMVAKGHKFRTNSDVEVILHLYEEYGTDFVNSLNGQFAFAIYDLTNQSLFCARDHMGIAPFYYTIVDGLFIFASEIKAILEHPSVQRKVDLVALDQMMTFPGLIAPRTFFDNIYSLENGHQLEIKDGRVKDDEYWDLIYPKVHEMERPMDESYYIEKLDDLLTKAVKYRLMSDVPLAFYISGGLDSSIIAAKIHGIDPSIKYSFSVAFTDKMISESNYQWLMSRHVQSNHCEEMFSPADISTRLRQAIRHSESALKETYNTASLVLSQAVRRNNIKVVLTGEGADELFAGYVGYRFDKMRAQSPSNAGNKPDPREVEIRRNLWGDENFFYEKQYYEYESTKRELYSNEINSFYSDVNCLNHPVINKERIDNIDILHKRSYIDYKLRLPEHLLADHGDRMAFANSVEARYPFLDKDVVDFVRVIPPDLKLKLFEEKYILKQLAKKNVPVDIIKRPKYTFVAPGSPELLRQDVEYINDLLSYDKIKSQGFFNPDTIEKLKKQYVQPGFKLNLPFENDMLIVAITLGVFLDEFKIS